MIDHRSARAFLADIALALASVVVLDLVVELADIAVRYAPERPVGDDWALWSRELAR